MSRRASPPPQDDSYLSQLGTSFLVAQAPSTDDHSQQQHGAAYEQQSRAGHSTVAPSYFSAPVVHPSDIYGRPAPPSEVNYNFADDVSTIAPDDSVSQLDRRLTGRRLGGPRPMESSMASTPAIPAIPEIHDPSLYQYVPPAMLEDDRSTIVARNAPIQQQAPNRAMESTSAAPVQSYTPRAYAEEEEEEDFVRGHAANQSSSAALPLVPGAADMSGFRSDVAREGGSGVSAYQPPVKGYAAVGREDDDDQPYAAYSRARDPDLEASIRNVRNGQDPSDGSATLASAWTNPLGYLKSRNSSYGESNKDSYPPGAFSMDDVNKSRTGPPSINIVEQQAQDPALMRTAPWWKRMIYDSTPTEVRIAEHKRDIGIQKRPWASWILSVVFCIVMIIEMVRMAQYTGSPIQTKPSFNVMIGPSGAVLINTGARFAACQKYVANVSDIDWICLKDTNKASVATQDGLCTISDICGFGGFATPEDADQSFRFVLPIFLHAGIVHLLLNVLAQCFSSAQVERQMGSLKFLILYIPSGIFGFILGDNFALVGQPSVGASGAIFGTHAAILVDLLAHWEIEYRPVRKLIYLIIEIIVGLALGLVPGVDNFAHIGGFCVGLLMAVLLFPIIHQTKRHRIIFIVLRLIAFPLVIVLFVVLTRNFYTTDPSSACSWCRYLSCWPTSSNNHCKGTGLSSTTSSGAFQSLFTILVTTFILPLL
ncbi:hypothetical protein BCR35DRAFT_274877 [Leucosporidium creatinivorum]|uniref:Rhomboid-type serine protease n=1 Tax=Leucosporidium creatinivorum TaxID=106004 RepID=A0A1Y2G324_9BASI|nr:hypothetical protein BCR35DRAFT_274877 [Leucosporidium creatinivorum]